MVYANLSNKNASGSLKRMYFEPNKLGNKLHA